jgi:hypothetical protein
MPHNKRMTLVPKLDIFHTICDRYRKQISMMVQEAASQWMVIETNEMNANDNLMGYRDMR